MNAAEQVKCREVVCAEPCSGISHSGSLHSLAWHFSSGQFFSVCYVLTSEALFQCIVCGLY